MAGPEVWHLSELATDERVDAWRAVISETHLPWEVRPAGEQRDGAEAWIRRRRLGGLSLVDCACQPCGGYRGSSQLAGTDGEYVGVLVVTGGSEVVEQAGRQMAAAPGTMLLWDSTAPAAFEARTALRKRTLLIPVDRFAEVFPHPGAVFGSRSLDTGAGQLFRSYLRSLAEQAHALDGPAAAAAGNAALELLVAAVRPESPLSAGTRHAALRAKVDEYIERHLGEPGLNPRQVAAANCMSVRSLYVLFERDGDTVSAYVRRRRLARSHADLVRIGSREPVTEIAFRWGFTDAANFSRAFRRQYGVSPSATRAAALGAAERPAR